MREGSRPTWEREVKRRIQSRIKERVMNVLIETHPIEVPEGPGQQAESRSWPKTPSAILKPAACDQGHSGRSAWFGDQACRVRSSPSRRNWRRQGTPCQARADPPLLSRNFAKATRIPEAIGWYYSWPQRLGAGRGALVTEERRGVGHHNARRPTWPVAFDDLMGNAAKFQRSRRMKVKPLFSSSDWNPVHRPGFRWWSNRSGRGEAAATSHSAPLKSGWKPSAVNDVTAKPDRRPAAVPRVREPGQGYLFTSTCRVARILPAWRSTTPCSSSSRTCARCASGRRRGMGAFLLAGEKGPRLRCPTCA